eukprot:CAMPEP_0203907456 /NCGR_PEP_ID=MMETSP0359-20131031/48955_1 /ASSEMBLY_ACC=CAM_ASM_000338 /TAXON_ID=268821 /ORGANISM="Scrippsiella Hangoei, Strain SHTV-5" /LENGTH=437 /DNA_ID=CAMNT_0050832275 /DNA_START=64 /DNA_END=1377 /DNA_ORIENTATION=+
MFRAEQAAAVEPPPWAHSTSRCGPSDVHGSGLLALAQAAEHRAAEAHWRAANAEVAMRRDADAAFFELERRANADAARLRVRLQAAESISQQQAQQLMAMRGAQTRAAQCEAENNDLRQRQAVFDQTLAEERARTTAESEAYWEAAQELQDFQTRIAKCRSIEEANVRMKKQVAVASERAERIEGLEKVVAHLRTQLKDAKAEANAAPLRRSPSGPRPVSPMRSSAPSSPPPNACMPMARTPTAAPALSLGGASTRPDVAHARTPSARASAAGKAAPKRVASPMQDRAARAGLRASEASLHAASAPEESTAIAALRHSNQRLRSELLDVTARLEKVAPWRSAAGTPSSACFAAAGSSMPWAPPMPASAAFSMPPLSASLSAAAAPPTVGFGGSGGGEVPSRQPSAPGPCSAPPPDFLLAPPMTTVGGGGGFEVSGGA